MGQSTALVHIATAHRDAQEWAQAEIPMFKRAVILNSWVWETILARSSPTWVLSPLDRLAGKRHLPISNKLLRLSDPTQKEERARALHLESVTLRQVGDLQRGAGDNPQAQAAYRQQSVSLQELQDDALEADAYYHLGLVSADMGNWNDAVANYDLALRAWMIRVRKGHRQ